MNVTSPNPTASSIAGGNNGTSNKSGKSGLDSLSDVNAFLTLLVKQLQNQDPLSPQDGSQFAAQLAQFSSLDQLVGINQRLGQMIDSTSAQRASMSLDATVPTNTVTPSTEI